jgi:Protein of unknown function (DUF3095)
MSDIDLSFFTAVPTFSDFAEVADPAYYRPLPDGWVLAVADVVASTRAIEEGRYKAVNMAGASVISALLNALGQQQIPFVFGGDGALVAVPGAASPVARACLAACKTWVGEELGLALRSALVRIEDIRAAGHDVRVGRFQVAPDVTYAMFTGGGASWAEAQMKRGRFAVDAAPPGTRPDLSGLSCRWNPIRARSGEIVSIIVVPANGISASMFAGLIAKLVASIGKQGREAHPVPETGELFPWPPNGLDYEARASAPKGLRLFRKLKILLEQLAGILIEKAGVSFGGFDPAVYRADAARNSDFRKFDDGLKLTIDVDMDRLRRIETLLDDAQARGICRYGLHRQTEALMTCFVPSPYARNHIHFIDGAAGGYAVASAKLKNSAVSSSLDSPAFGEPRSDPKVRPAVGAD